MNGKADYLPLGSVVVVSGGIRKYKSYKKEYGNDITLNAHMIIEYGDKAWVLYAGNHNILTETYANYNTYFEHIKYCKEKGIKNIKTNMKMK